MGREIPDEEEFPRKRVKISNDADSNSPIAPVSAIEAPAALDNQDVQALKEAEVGITDFVSPHLPGFSGILKKRYPIKLTPYNLFPTLTDVLINLQIYRLPGQRNSPIGQGSAPEKSRTASVV